MSNLMLLGVLRMPFDDRGDLHLVQLKQRCLQAADQIESDESEIEALRSLIMKAAPTCWALGHHLDGAVAWEKEAVALLDQISDTGKPN